MPFGCKRNWRVLAGLHLLVTFCLVANMLHIFLHCLHTLYHMLHAHTLLSKGGSHVPGLPVKQAGTLYGLQYQGRQAAGMYRSARGFLGLGLGQRAET